MQLVLYLLISWHFKLIHWIHDFYTIAYIVFLNSCSLYLCFCETYIKTCQYISIRHDSNIATSVSFSNAACHIRKIHQHALENRQISCTSFNLLSKGKKRSALEKVLFKHHQPEGFTLLNPLLLNRTHSFHFCQTTGCYAGWRWGAFWDL